VKLVPGWHPLVVHFPLALVVTAAFCLTAARLRAAGRHAPALATVGTWNLCLGAVALFVALGTGTGLAAVLDLHVDAAAQQAISAHVKAAMLTAVLVLLAAVWRGVGVAADSRPSRLFIVVLWIATSVLVVTGYRGGQNVYVHGIGVSVGAGDGAN
jgi:uncharacterized membrane protein